MNKFFSKRNYNEISDVIIEGLGGKDNISAFVHCVTRLHFSLKERNRVNAEVIDQCPGVYGSQWIGEEFQVIIGKPVDEIYDTIRRRFQI